MNPLPPSAKTPKKPQTSAQLSRYPKLQAGRQAANEKERAQRLAAVAAGRVVCAGCKQEKRPSDYPGSRTNRHGEPRYRYCKTCHVIKQRVLRLRWIYGLSPEDYERMNAFQNGSCFICQNPAGTRRLAIDHDHKTGQIRGLLCTWCNRAIGQFRDDVERVKRVLAYFTNPPCTDALGAPRFGSKGRVTNKAATRRRLNAKPRESSSHAPCAEDVDALLEKQALLRTGGE